MLQICCLPGRFRLDKAPIKAKSCDALRRIVKNALCSIAFAKYTDKSQWAMSYTAENWLCVKPQWTLKQ